MMSEPEIPGESPPMDILLDIPLQLSVELGRTRMTVSEVLRLGRGSVVELTKAAGEALDIFVNDRLVARGEAVVVGERYGVRITEIHNTSERHRPGARAEG
jgi:flagellar motor switch protein FliN/FliY